MYCTHCTCGEFWRVVIHVCHRDDGSGRVRETIVKVSFHVSGLDDDRVLLDFLEGKGNWVSLGLVDGEWRLPQWGHTLARAAGDFLGLWNLLLPCGMWL